MPPTANAGTAPVPYAFTALPVDVPLNGGGSTPGVGASSITQWQWDLKAKPTGSSASLTNATTMTPTLSGVDRPGTYIVRCRCKNNLGEWSAGVSAGDDGGTYPDAWAIMPTSIIKIEAETQNAALVIKAESEHDYFSKDEAFFLEVDRLGGTLAFTPNVAPRSAWVQSMAGDAQANGSMSSPFNPTSAAAKGFDGPWAQAIAALNALDCSVQPYTGRTIHALGGTYTEDVSIGGAAPWNIICHGLVQIGVVEGTTHTFTYQATNAGLTFEGAPIRADLFIGGVGSIQNAVFFAVSGNMRLKNAGAFAWLIRMTGVYVGGTTAVLDTFATGPTARLRDCRFDGTFNIPNLGIVKAYNCEFDDDLTCKYVYSANLTSFAGDVTVTVAATNGYDHGFFDCSFDYNGAVFTGPVASALFDAVTTRRFATSGCTFAGGASRDDYIEHVVTPLYKFVNLSGIAAPTTAAAEVDQWTAPANFDEQQRPTIRGSASFRTAANGNLKKAGIALGGIPYWVYQDSHNSHDIRVDFVLTWMQASNWWIQYDTTRRITGAATSVESGDSGSGSIDISTIGVVLETPTAVNDIVLFKWDITWE